MAVLAANALVRSCSDYCNFLFRGLSSFNQHKLQSIRNPLAQMVTNHTKYAHVTPLLKLLHWLPVENLCMFKKTTLAYNFRHSSAPSNFGPSLSLTSWFSKHSTTSFLLFTPPVIYFGNSFTFNAPKIWNATSRQYMKCNIYCLCQSKSSKLSRLQKPIHQSHPITPASSLV